MSNRQIGFFCETLHFATLSIMFNFDGKLQKLLTSKKFRNAAVTLIIIGLGIFLGANFGVTLSQEVQESIRDVLTEFMIVASGTGEVVPN